MLNLNVLVGSSLIPLNIKLEQDDLTVCFNHKIVAHEPCIIDLLTPYEVPEPFKGMEFIQLSIFLVV